MDRILTKTPLRIGLTGGIASGKTTVSHLFAERGAPIIDADVIAHAVVQPGQPALALIRDAFGGEICHPDGHLNRNTLRQRVFADELQRKRLEAILHPLILETMLTQAAQLETPYCLLSIPLLIEAQQTHITHRILVVDCPVEMQRHRLANRNGFGDAEIDRILASQVDRETRLSVADDVIENTSDLSALEKRVEILHWKYLNLNFSR